MPIKNLFSKKESFVSRKQMRENLKSDPFFQKKVLGDSRVAKILNHPSGQKKVHDLFLEKARDGKIDMKDMNEIAHKIEQGRVEGISSAKGRLVAKELLSDSARKYASEKPKPEKITPDSQNDPAKKSSKNSPAFLAYRAKPKSDIPAAGKDTNRYTSFFDAMRSVNRNRKPR